MSIDGKYTVPTVAVHTDIFFPVTQSVVRMNGMPRMRQVYVPQPIMGKTPEQLRAYIDGPDMKTGRPFMQEVIEGLTRPLDSQDLRDSSFDRSTPRFLDVDTEENLNALFEEYFPGSPPVRSTPVVTLPWGLLFSIDAIAVAESAA